MLRVAILLLLLPSFALAQESDPAARVNAAIASKLGSLEIINASLIVQLDVTAARVRELERMCGEPCKAKVEPAK
jgi:predicted outer membrane protein